MIDFISMHTFQDEIVDCRMLQLECHFNRVTQQQLKVLALFYLIEVKELLVDAFFLDWSFQNRRVKESTLLKKLEKTETMCDFDFVGNVRTSCINNHKALDEYNQALFRRLTFEGPMSEFSIDYWETFNELFLHLTDLEEIHGNLLKLFQMEGRFYKQKWFGQDVIGHFFSCPYSKLRNLYYGHFEFRIALPCLGKSVVQFSNQLVDILEKSTEFALDISGRVTLSPIKPPSFCSDYMNYFGGWNRHCPLGREPYMKESEWNHACFLRGVDWYNLLSPLQASKLKERLCHNGIHIKLLPNGGCAVTTKKDILQLQVSDLCLLKRFLYPIIYPGGFEIPIDALLNPRCTGYIVKPRQKWEAIPVLDEEIAIESDRIVIQYQNSFVYNLA